MQLDNLPTHDLLNIKIGALLAGLSGAFVFFLQKTEGSLQAKMTGFVCAIISTIYMVPLIVWGFEWKFALVPHSTVEQAMAFVFGMLAQTITENFVDDPAGSLYKWAAGAKRIKRVLWNGEAFAPANASPIPKSGEEKQ